MKKILSIFLLIFAFSIGANAQTDAAKREGEIRVKAKKDLHTISQVVDLSNDDVLFRGLYQLLIDKHTNLSKEGITEQERKDESKRVSDKLIGSFSEDQIARMRQNGVYDLIVN